MRRRLVLGIGLAILLLVFHTSCDLGFSFDAADSSLHITGKTVYNSADSVLIQFSFTGEEDKHLCRYSIAKNDGTSFITVAEGEEELLSGVLYDRIYDISSYGNGHYRFSFSVLLERNGVYDTPPFLQEILDFWVDPTGPSGEVTISPGGGPYGSAQQIVLDHPEIDTIDGSPARIFYTTDGSDPTSSSVQYQPGQPIVVSSNTTLKAIAIDMADRASGISEEIYEIDLQVPVQPQATPGSGTYAVATVDLTHPEYPTSADGTGVSIYYTLDGTSPSDTSPQYTGSAIVFPGDGDWLLKAIAIDEAGNASSELVESYLIDTGAPGIPNLDRGSGECSGAFSLTISHSEIPTPSGSEVTIYYTMGSIASPPPDPDAGSSVYTAAIPIDRNRIVKAIAIDAVGNSSDIVSREYTFLRIDSVSPESLSKANPVTIVDVSGFFYAYDETSLDIYVTDGSVQVSCYIDGNPLVTTSLNLHLGVLGSELGDSGIAEGAATLVIVDTNTGDSVGVPITIGP
jgi:hypothetical protein